MTYCKNFNKLFANIDKNLKEKGYLIFTHRIDLWKQQDFLSILKKHQKSFKIHPRTFQGSFERICVLFDHQNGAKRVPRASKLSQNGHPRAQKGDKINNIQ